MLGVAADNAAIDGVREECRGEFIVSEGEMVIPELWKDPIDIESSPGRLSMAYISDTISIP